MKKFLVVFSILTMSASYAEAARLYMQKDYSLNNSNGTYELTCKFFNRKVRITERRVSDGLPSSSLRVEPTFYSGATLGVLVSVAQVNSLVSTPFNICDGGSSTTKAFRASGTSFILRKFEDCGPKHYKRTGHAAARLRAITDRYCESYYPTL